MSTFQTTAGPGAGPGWQPLGAPDYGAIGFTTVVDVAAALLVVHMVSNAGWPPYTAAIPQMIVFSSLAAILATLGVSLRYGMWGADGEEIGCAGVAWLVWIGLGALFSTAFLRVYRYHDVLVKHNGLMWPVVPQLIGLLMPFTLAPAFLASPDLAAFDANSLECQSASLVPGLFSFGAMGILALTSLVLAFRLRVARVQAPCEFESAVVTSLTLFAAAIALPLVHFQTEQEPGDRRVAMLVLTALTSVGVVGSPVFHPLRSFIVDEEKLETSGDYSLGEWRSKKRTKYIRLQSSKFQEAASSEREIESFPAIAEFFRVIMAREEIEGYHLLQASTMRILDAYFRKGAPDAAAVPLSDMCRSNTLTFRASSAFIFDRARGEILDKIGVGKVLLPDDDEALTVSRYRSASTTGASSQCTASSPGQTDAEGSPASRAASVAINKRPSPLTASPSPQPPPPSRASSTASSLHYSTDSDPSQSPRGLSPLHQQAPPSPVKPDNSRRSAEIRATSAPEPPMSPPLNYAGDRAVDRDRNNKNKKKKQDKPGTSGFGIGRSGGGRPTNPIISLFGRLGGGAGARSRVQDGPSDEQSPSVVHMADDDVDCFDVYAGSMEEGQATKTLERTGGDTGVRTMATVVDVHAAFGLARRDDEDDEETGQYRSTGFLGAVTKKKKSAQASSSASSGIGGYGGVLSGRSTGPDSGNDLAEAARAIPKPLFGDSSRAVGRQNTRRSCLKSSLKSDTSAGAAAEAGSAFSSNITTSSGFAGVPRGHCLDLGDAYGLDLAEEGGEAAEAGPSPPPQTATINPLFGGSGGGAKVKTVARAFDADAQTASGGRVAVDNNKIGLSGRATRKKRGGERKKGGGAAVNRLGSSGSALQADVFTIAEAGEEEEEEEEEEEKEEEEEGGGHNGQTV